MKINLVELMRTQNAAMRAKGFWDEPVDLETRLMLCVGEIGETLEAHRENKYADFAGFGKRMLELTNSINTSAFESEDAIQVHYNEVFVEQFRSKIRGTVDEELADVVLRLADIGGGYGLAPESVEAFRKIPFATPDSFGKRLFQINNLITGVITPEGNYSPYTLSLGISKAVTAIEALAEAEGIDLQKAISLKVRYNLTRGYKHSKAY